MPAEKSPSDRARLAGWPSRRTLEDQDAKRVKGSSSGLASFEARVGRCRSPLPSDELRIAGKPHSGSVLGILV